MTYQQARREIDAAYHRGDIDSDVYAMERQRIEYEHGEKMSAQDAPEVVA